MNTKGGVGKTTITYGVAGALARRGLRVHVIDADPQGGVAKAADTAKPEQPYPATVHPVGMLGGNVGDAALKAVEHNDVILIDTPGRNSLVVKAALGACDLALVPCRPGPNEARALEEVIELLVEFQVIQGRELAARLVLNNMPSNPKLEVIRDLRPVLENCGIPMLKTELGSRTWHEKAMSDGLLPHDYGLKGAQTARELDAVARELCQTLGIRFPVSDDDTAVEPPVDEEAETVVMASAEVAHG